MGQVIVLPHKRPDVIGTIFYSDGHGKYLLRKGDPRYVNVFTNMWGDIYYGEALASDTKSLMQKSHTGKPPLYRIVVRRKPWTAETN